MLTYDRSRISSSSVDKKAATLVNFGIEDIYFTECFTVFRVVRASFFCA